MGLVIGLEPGGGRVKGREERGDLGGGDGGFGEAAVVDQEFEAVEEGAGGVAAFAACGEGSTTATP